MRLTRFLPIFLGLAALALTGCQPPAEPETTATPGNTPGNTAAKTGQADSSVAPPPANP